MKKLLIALLISTTFAIPAAALAQGGTAATSTTTAPETAPNANAAVNPTGPASPSCGLDPVCWVSYIPAAIMWIFLEIASTLLWVSGYLLNLALYKGVVDFGASIGGTGGIGIGWAVLRDLGNIVLIFGFIYIGFQTILGLDNFGVKKTLPKLLLFAILLNFSLFISQFVIDVSNLFSTAIYSNVTVQGSGGCSITDVTCASNYGLASAIANDLGVGTALNGNALSSFGSGSGYTVLITMVMATIFVLITAVTFFAAAILLIIRIVVLSFIMVTAPIGFAGMALPPLQKYAKEWWGLLLSQSFFVPAYLLLVLIGLKIAEGVAGGKTNDLLGALTSSSGGATGAFITFALIIGFMITALISAKKLGGMGADFAVKTAGGAAFGTTAFVGRRTIGRASNYAAKQIRKSSIGRNFVGSALAKGLDRGAKGSFDFRGTTAVEKFSDGTGIKLGKAGGTGGYKKIEDEAVKQREAYSKSLQNTKSEQETIDAERKKLEKETEENEKKLASLENDLLAATTEEQKKDLRQKIKDEEERFKLLSNQINRDIGKYLKAPQVGIKDAEGNTIVKGYTDSLDSTPWWAKPYEYGTAGGGADVIASKKIKAESRKKQNQKDVDSLLASLKGEGDKGGGKDKPKA